MSQNVFYNQYVSKSSKHAPLPLLYKVLRPFEEHRYTAIERLIAKKHFNSCLDVGSGSGEFLLNNQRRFKKVYGTDIVPQLITKAKKQNFSIPAQFYSLDAGREKLPLKKESLDLVVSIATMQYIYDLELFFSEVHRTLKPGGTFIFEVPNFLVIWRRFQLLFGIFPSTSLFHEQWDGGVIHYFTEDRLRAFCNHHHFSVELVTCSGIFSTIRKVSPSLLGANLIFVCQKTR